MCNSGRSACAAKTTEGPGQKLFNATKKTSKRRSGGSWSAKPGTFGSAAAGQSKRCRGRSDKNSHLAREQRGFSLNSASLQNCFVATDTTTTPPSTAISKNLPVPVALLHVRSPKQPPLLVITPKLNRSFNQQQSLCDATR